MMPNPAAYRAKPSPQRVEPLATVEMADTVTRPSIRRCQCGKCGKMYLDSAVVNKDPARDRCRRDMIIIPRWMYCDHCDHIQTWVEQADILHNEPVPSGQIELGPGYITDRHKIAMFLKQHPQARGVIDN